MVIFDLLKRISICLIVLFLPVMVFAQEQNNTVNSGSAGVYCDPTLNSIVISGPIEVIENSTANYVCTAYYNNGTRKDVTSCTYWCDNSDAASINCKGCLTVKEVSSNIQCTIKAKYDGKAAEYNVLIKNTSPTLERIEISGPSEVNEKSTAHYTCTAYYNDGSTKEITNCVYWRVVPSTSTDWEITDPSCTQPFDYAKIDSSGNLVTSEVPSDIKCIVKAKYMEKEDDCEITIKDTNGVEHIEISGLREVQERSSANYTCIAYLKDGSQKDITHTVSWEVESEFSLDNSDNSFQQAQTSTDSDDDCPYASINDDGHLVTFEISADEPCYVKAKFEDDSESEYAILIKDVPIINRIAINGPAEVNENSSADYSCTAYYDNGTSQTSSLVSWNDDSQSASINDNGHLTTSEVQSDQQCNITAIEGTSESNYTITIKNIPLVEYLEITGPSEVNENSEAAYTCTAYLDDGTTQSVTNTASWSVDSANASVDTSGNLQTTEVSSTQTCSVSAAYKGKSAIIIITIKNIPALDHIAVIGPNNVYMNSSADFACVAYYDDATTQTLTNSIQWSVNSTYASIDANGHLTTTEITSDQPCKITAVYGSKIAEFDMTIKYFVTKIEYLGKCNSECNAVFVQGNYAYIGEGKNISIIDVSNFANPTKVGTLELPEQVEDVFVLGTTAYVADGKNGLQIVDVAAPSNPILIGTYDTQGHFVDIYVAENLAYIADEYRGLIIVDVLDPTSPVLVGSYYTPDYSRGLYVSGTTVYLANSNRGLLSIDITDPSHPALLSALDTPGYAVGVYANEQYAYVADSTRGMQIVDVANAAQPVISGSYDMHEQAENVFVSGDFAFLSDNKSHLQVINISDASQLQLKDIYKATNIVEDIYVVDSLAYIADGKGGLIILRYDTTPPKGVVNSYNFESAASDDGWTGSGYEQYFTLPLFTHSTGSLIIQSMGLNTFGYWRGPLDGIPYIKDNVYKAMFTIRGSAPQAEAPGFRCHLDTQSATTFGLLNVESWMGGAEAPDWTARNYTVYFDPMDQSGYQSDEATDDLFVGFDITCFDPSDNVYGAYFIDDVQVERFDKSLITATTVKTYDTAADFSNWVFGGYPDYFTPTEKIVGVACVGCVGHLAQNDNTNTYGYWESSRTANEVNIQPNALYRARFTVSSSSEQSKCPQLRLRIGTESNQMAGVYVVNSNLDGLNSPDGTGKIYDVYLYPPQSDVNADPIANGLIFAMDMLNFGGSDDPNGNLTLQKVEVQTVEF